MRLATIASYNQATHLHRCIWPFKWLAKDRPNFEWKVSTTDQVGGFEVLWLYNGMKFISKWGDVAALKRKGVRLVLTLDDTIWSHPEWRTDQPSTESINSVNLGCELADLIVTSTPALADEVRMPHKTVIGPNLIESAKYQTPTPPTDDDRIRIMWAGGGGHWADLQLIDKACCRIKEKWGEKVEFHFLGDGPDQLLRDHWGNGIALTRWYELDEHWYRLHTIRPHIVLAPLAECTFNNCKSNIRILEGWSLNAAVVSSPVGEYRLVRDHKDGLIAETENEWFVAIETLIQNEQLRHSLALSGHKRVREDWDWNNPNARKKWHPVLERLDKLAT